MVKDEQRRERWPRFEDILDPHFREKKWFAPLGDQESLDEACREIRRFSRHAPWTAERETAVIAEIKQLAFLFRFCQWFEWMRQRLRGSSSKTELRIGLRKISVAIKRVRKLVASNPASVDIASEHYPGKSAYSAYVSIWDALEHLDEAYATALAGDQFRRKGRPERPVGACVLLVLKTRDLMGKFAGHKPGFSRETEVSHGPLVRTVKAIHRYATGEPAGLLDRFIAQAEQLSKKDADVFKLSFGL